MKKILALLLATAPLCAQQINPNQIRTSNVVYAQSTDTLTKIEAACPSACLYISSFPQTFTLTGNKTLSSNVQVSFVGLGKWTVNGAFTLTFGSHVVTAPPTTQIFAGTSTIGGLLSARPEWFGDITTSAPFLKAVNALNTNGVLSLNLATYTSPFGSGLGLTKSIQIVGQNMPQKNDPTHPTALTGGTIIRGEFNASIGFTLDNVGIDAGYAYNGGTCTYGLFLARDHAQPAGYIYGVRWNNIRVLTCGHNGDGGHGTLLENAFGAVVTNYYFDTINDGTGSGGADYGFINKSSNSYYANINSNGASSACILNKDDYGTFADGHARNNKFIGYRCGYEATPWDSVGPLLDSQYDEEYGNVWTNGNFDGLSLGFRVLGLNTFSLHNDVFDGLVAKNMQNACFYINSSLLVDNLDISHFSCEVNPSAGGSFGFALLSGTNIRFSDDGVSSSTGATLAAGFYDATNSGSNTINGAHCTGFTASTACVNTTNDQAHRLIASNITTTGGIQASSGQIYDQHNNPIDINADMYWRGTSWRRYSPPGLLWDVRDQFNNVQTSLDDTGHFLSAFGTFGNLTSGNCVQASTAGLLTTTGGPCSGGSAFITSLTTTGSSGAATVSSGVLNIPVYSGGSGPTIQTNGTPNTLQTTLNFITSTTNATGLTITPSNPATGNEKFELTGTINSGNVPTLNQNTTGTASNLSGTPALPNGTTATTQTVGDNTTKLATTAFVIANAGASPLTTKGDLYGFSTVNARVAVGTNGQCLTADSTSATGVRWTTCAGGGVSGSGTIGKIPLWTGSTTALGDSHLDDGLTTAATITSTEPIVAPSYTASGTTPGSASYGAGTGSIPALLANSGGFAAPVTGGTSYLYKLPATAVAGILHAAAPGTVDGVNESALTSSAVSLTADVTGLLPHANIASTAVTPGSYTSANITVAADGSITAAANGTGSSPLTTKGDLFGFSTVGARVAVGTNGQCLQADSTAATGVSWQTCTGGSGTVTHTAGALTALAVVVGNGSADIKVDTGCSTDGAGVETCLSYKTNGTTAGFMDYAQGSTSSGVAPCNTANSWCVQAPATLSSNFIETLQTPATGFTWRTLSGSAITDTTGTSTNLITLWSGTCSSSTFLRGDGACATPSGSGTVTSVGFTGGLISVANPTTTPAFTVAGTSGGIPYFASTSTWASSALLPTGDFVLGGGAGGAPTATFSVVPAANGGSGVANTATHTLGSSNQNWATLGTGIVKNTTTTGAISNAASADVTGLWSGTCNSGTFLRGDGACAAGGGGDTITSPNGTIAVGGTSSATSLDLAGAAGRIMAGATPALTATPTLGATGTVGTLTFGNATSGLVTLGAVTGALGTVTASLPANTGTLAELNLAQTWSALQTFGTNFSVGGVTAAGATGTSNVVFSNTPTLVTPVLGAATATSLLATGNVDGTAPVTITTGTTATLGGTFKSGYTFNQEATAATAVAYTLPTAAAGLQYCVGNSYNGSAATTGVLTVNTSASGQFIIFTDGTLSATGGNVTSGGAARDAACFVGSDSTHWLIYVQSGTWTKH